MNRRLIFTVAFTSAIFVAGWLPKGVAESATTDDFLDGNLPELAFCSPDANDTLSLRQYADVNVSTILPVQTSGNVINNVKLRDFSWNTNTAASSFTASSFKANGDDDFYARLGFDFIPQPSRVSFNSVFASDSYSLMASKDVSNKDVFGFFIRKTDAKKLLDRNDAVAAENESYKYFSARKSVLEYDWHNFLLKTEKAVISAENIRLKSAVANVGSRYKVSDALLKKASIDISANITNYSCNKSDVKHVYDGALNNYLQFNVTADGSDRQVVINFSSNVASFLTKADGSAMPISSVITIPASQTSYALNYNIINDIHSDGDVTVSISIKGYSVTSSYTIHIHRKISAAKLNMSNDCGYGGQAWLTIDGAHNPIMRLDNDFNWQPVGKPFNGLTAGTTHTIYYKEDGDCNEYSLSFQTPSCIVLQEDRWIVQKNHSVEIDALSNDSPAHISSGFSIKTQPTAGNVTVSGTKFVYANTAAPAIGQLDSFQYQVASNGIVQSAWVYVYILDDMNGTGCKGYAHTVEFLKDAPSISFAWQSNSNGGAIQYGSSFLTPSLTSDVTFFVELLGHQKGAFEKGKFTVYANEISIADAKGDRLEHLFSGSSGKMLISFSSSNRPRILNLSYSGSGAAFLFQSQSSGKAAMPTSIPLSAAQSSVSLDFSVDRTFKNTELNDVDVIITASIEGCRTSRTFHIHRGQSNMQLHDEPDCGTGAGGKAWITVDNGFHSQVQLYRGQFDDSNTAPWQSVGVLPFTGLVAGTEYTIVVKDSLGIRKMYKTFTVRSCLGLNNDFHTVQKYHVAEINAFANDELPAGFLHNGSIMDFVAPDALPQNGSLSASAKGMNANFVYVNNSAPAGQIDSFRYEININRRTSSAWVYIYVLEDENGAVTCDNQTYTAKLKKNPVDTSLANFNWFFDAEAKSPCVGNPTNSHSGILRAAENKVFFIQPINLIYPTGTFKPGKFTIYSSNDVPNGKFVWTGRINSDWNNPRNWNKKVGNKIMPANLAPTFCANVVVPSVADNFPEIRNEAYPLTNLRSKNLACMIDNQTQSEDVLTNHFRRKDSTLNRFTVSILDLEPHLQVDPVFSLKAAIPAETIDDVVRFSDQKFIADEIFFVDSLYNLPVVQNIDGEIVFSLQTVNSCLAYLDFNKFRNADSWVIANGYYISPLQSFLFPKSDSSATVSNLTILLEWATTVDSAMDISYFRLRPPIVAEGISYLQISHSHKQASAVLVYSPTVSHTTENENLPAIIFDKHALAAYLFSTANGTFVINRQANFGMCPTRLGIWPAAVGELNLSFSGTGDVEIPSIFVRVSEEGIHLSSGGLPLRAIESYNPLGQCFLSG
ncbi:MAG: choice-of-anchor L domain-containing protein [Tannerellaceae bacterium]|jgi:hypothetical protein|nr:choice-of-anchor L domain-containing protein [Tannerellaceae bacterium]